MPLGVYEVALIGKGPKGEAIVNTFHYMLADDGVAETNAALLGSGFRDTIKDAFEACVTTDWTGFMINTTCIHGPNEGQMDSVFIPEWAGDKAPPSASLNITAIIRRRNNAGGRHGRGRLYISPIAEGDVNVDGEIVDNGEAFAALAEAMLEQFPVGVENTAVPCLWAVNGETALVIHTTDPSPMSGMMRSRRLRFPN